MAQTLRKYVYDDKTMRRWRLALLASSFCNGFIFASWMARLPSIREHLGIAYGNLGILLFFATIGSFSAVTLSGAIVAGVGSKRIIRAGACLVGLGACGFGISIVGGSFPSAAASLLAIGCGQGSWSVAANVEGASCEVAAGKVLMPKLHGAFSVGTLSGALLSFLLDAMKISIGAHFVAVGLSTIAMVSIFSVYFKADRIERDAQTTLFGADLPKIEDPRPDAFAPIDPMEPVAAIPDALEPRPKKIAAVFRAWQEPRTLALGFIVLGMALGEGAASDWVHISMVETYHVGDSWRAVGYVIFVLFMAVGRLSGTHILKKFDRMTVLQTGATVAITAILAFVFAPSIFSGAAFPVSCLAIVLWALGVSLGFPIVMSMAAEDPANAAVRVSVVSTIGYAAFLCGPPLLGFAADLLTVRYALLFVLIFIAITFTVSSKLKRPLEEPRSIPIGGVKI